MEYPKLKERISKPFFEDKAVNVAESLLGTLLVNEELGLSGLIVETEAYLGEKDPSCHLARNREDRNKIFYKGAGTVYVFKIYYHHNLNFITEYNGYPEGVLIRAIEPVEGLEDMMVARETEERTEIGSGPGKLTQALKINKAEHNGLKLSESPISVYETDLTNFEVDKTRRIGISKAENWPLRFYIKDNPHISKNLKVSEDSFNHEKFYRDL